MLVYNDWEYSEAIGRVVKNLRLYAPSEVEFTGDPRAADLTILHVVGRRDQAIRNAGRILGQGKRYAVIQYCLRSTQKPDTADWSALWREAKLVWSYYDLFALCREDDIKLSFNFYHAPLGVDSSVFKRVDKPEDEMPNEWMICTNGYGYMTESVRECYKAAQKLGWNIVHLGPSIGHGIEYRKNLTDMDVAWLYRQCNYVAGLRRTEGFELPAAEGLLCGTRPILFDRPHYRQWYHNWGIYIPERPREQVIESLVEIFSKDLDRVSDTEIEEAKEVFSWKSIISTFWAGVLA